jgi:hypothetical protein
LYPAGIRSLDLMTKVGATEQTLLIGTKGSEIYEKTGE